MIRLRFCVIFVGMLGNLLHLIRQLVIPVCPVMGSVTFGHLTEMVFSL